MHFECAKCEQGSRGTGEHRRNESGEDRVRDSLKLCGCAARRGDAVGICFLLLGQWRNQSNLFHPHQHIAMLPRQILDPVTPIGRDHCHLQNDGRKIGDPFIRRRRQCLKARDVLLRDVGLLQKPADFALMLQSVPFLSRHSATLAANMRARFCRQKPHSVGHFHRECRIGPSKCSLKNPHPSWSTTAMRCAKAGARLPRVQI